MFAAPLLGYRGDGAFYDLEQRLLHALAGHIAGDRRMVRFAVDLVDFVDIDDAALGALDIVVGRLQELQDNALDVLADIAGLGQRCRIRNREGHIEKSRECLRKQRLARTGRSDEQESVFCAPLLTLLIVWTCRALLYWKERALAPDQADQRMGRLFRSRPHPA